MCGIYGAGSPLDIDNGNLAKIKLLGQKLQHRGPDDNSEISESHYLLGFNRLAIVDVENGMQPFFNRKRDIVSTANGEIYNYLELRKELLEAGYELTSNCDIEVLPHLYEIYGDHFVTKLRGMFAIAILDNRSSELKLFVDRLGEKPLYWTIQNRTFFYSSEITPMLESKIASMSIDLQHVSSYLKFGFVPDPNTIIRGVYRVPPATILTYSISNGSFDKKTYWDANCKFDEINNPVSTLKSCFQQIGETICQGEVKIGIALSGGVDSKLVARLATLSGAHLESITIGYSERTRHDESATAMLAAQEIGIKHHIKKISSDQATQIFRQACSLIDEPIADISCVNYLALFDAAKNLGIKVLLMGHGSDEILMSYKWLNMAVKRASIRASTLSGNFEIVRYFKILQNPFVNFGVGDFFEAFYTSKENLFTLRQIVIDYIDFKSGVKLIDFYELSPERRKKSSLARKLEGKEESEILLSKKFGISESYDTNWNQARLQLIADYLRINGLLQLDKLSMAKSIEIRNPLLDFTVVEALLGSNWRNPSTPVKSLLKAGLNSSLSEVSMIQSKRGFSPPTRVWYRSLLNEFSDELKKPRSIELGIFPRKWKRFFTRPFSWNGLKSPVWFELLMMEIWIRETEKRVGRKFTRT